MDMSGHDKLDGCQVNGGAAFAGECAQLRNLSGHNLVGVPASMKLPLPNLQRRYGAAYGAVVVAATVVGRLLGAGVGRGVGIGVGLGVGCGTGRGVGRTVGAQASPCRTPHDVDAHWVPENAS